MSSSSWVCPKCVPWPGLVGASELLANGSCLASVAEPLKEPACELMLSTSELGLLDCMEGEASGEADGVAGEAAEAAEAGEVERRKLWAVSVSTLGKAPSRLACTQAYTSS